MCDLISRLVIDRRGGISVEYALVAGLVGVITALAWAALGDALDGKYEKVVVVVAEGQDLSREQEL